MYIQVCIQKVEAKLLTSSCEVCLLFSPFFLFIFYTSFPACLIRRGKKNPKHFQEQQNADHKSFLLQPWQHGLGVLTQDERPWRVERDLTSPESPVLQSLTSFANSKDFHTFT